MLPIIISPLVRRQLCYIASKPKGLVLENTFGSAVAHPHRQAGFCHVQIPGRGAFAPWPHPQTEGRVYGLDGQSGNTWRTAEPVFSTSSPPALLENSAGGFSLVQEQKP